MSAVASNQRSEFLESDGRIDTLAPGLSGGLQ
jgi:hypothetical protein